MKKKTKKRSSKAVVHTKVNSSKVDACALTKNERRQVSQIVFGARLNTEDPRLAMTYPDMQGASLLIDEPNESRRLFKACSTIEFNKRVLTYTICELGRQEDDRTLRKMPPIIFNNILELLKNDLLLFSYKDFIDKFQEPIESIFEEMGELPIELEREYSAERVLKIPTLEVNGGTPLDSQKPLIEQIDIDNILPGVFYLVRVVSTEDGQYSYDLCELGTEAFDKLDITVERDVRDNDPDYNRPREDFAIIYAVPNERTDLFRDNQSGDIFPYSSAISSTSIPTVAALLVFTQDSVRRIFEEGIDIAGVRVLYARNAHTVTKSLSNAWHIVICAQNLLRMAFPKRKVAPRKPFELRGDDRGSIYKYLMESESSWTAVPLRTPTESYENVLRFIKEVCADPKIKEIYVTLYRVAENSFVLDQLLSAASRGAKVNIFIELHAHGDEQHNLSIYQSLRAMKNVRVYADTIPYKVHAKFFMGLSSSRADHIEGVAHISTGNYNEKTAQSYYDSHLFIKEPCELDELLELFMRITKTGKNRKDAGRKGFGTRNTPLNQVSNKVCSEINWYANFKERNSKCNVEITLKCNHINDFEVEDAIVCAANRGVKFNLIVRTTCSISPTENIRVFYCAGEKLEHDRIYLFKASGPDGSSLNYASIMISSADLATRNLDHRVEFIYTVGGLAILGDGHPMSKVGRYFDEILAKYCEPAFYEDMHVIGTDSVVTRNTTGVVKTGNMFDPMFIMTGTELVEEATSNITETSEEEAK